MLAPPPDGQVDDCCSAADVGPVQPARTRHVRLLFVHGVQADDDSRRSADRDLADLETYIRIHFETRADAYVLAHPGEQVAMSTRRVNLYTDNDGALLDPSIDAPSDGTGIPAARRWRQQLVRKLEAAYPGGEGNIVLVGHSTGARTAMEVTANVGDDGVPEGFDWGVQPRVVGVVSLHGMIDRLQRDTYEFAGPTSYVTACKFVQETGWCEYSGFVSAIAAADWVAVHRRTLTLISWADCGASAWSGRSDKSLPLHAQGHPAAVGMLMAQNADDLYVPAHGVLYGHFCHSDLTRRSAPQHHAAVAAAGDRLLTWLLEVAPRVVNAEKAGRPIETRSLEFEQPSPEYDVGARCPPGERDFGPPEIAGRCVHPGFADGDDHPMNDANVVTVEDGPDCDGSFHWAHLHRGERHAGRHWAKTYSVPQGGGLLSTLAPE